MINDVEHVRLLSGMDDGDVYYIAFGSVKGTIFKKLVNDDEYEWLLYENVDNNHTIFYGTYHMNELYHMVDDAKGYCR